MERMTLTRPSLPRTQVVAKDMVSGKSKSITVYRATPDEVIKALEQLVHRGQQQEQAETSVA